MAVYRRSKRHRFLLFLLALASVTAITLDYRDGGTGALESLRRGARELFAPVQSVADAAFSPVGDFFGGITRYGDLRAENARLRQELERAQGDSVRGTGAVRQRDALLELDDLDLPGAIPAVSARVVATSPSNFRAAVDIDRGSDDGIANGMPVVTGAGLVGRLTDVSSSRATVLLLSDRESSIGVRLTGSGDVGVATGSGPGQPLVVDLVNVSTTVQPGEPVVTSGLQQSVFPPELPVGRVREVRGRPGALQKELTLDPVADLRRLEFVQVLQWRAP